MPRKPDGAEKKVIKSYQIAPGTFRDFEEIAYRLNIKSLSAQIENLIKEFVERENKKKK